MVSAARMGFKLGYLRDRKLSAKRSCDGKAKDETKEMMESHHVDTLRSDSM